MRAESASDFAGMLRAEGGDPYIPPKSRPLLEQVALGQRLVVARHSGMTWTEIAAAEGAPARTLQHFYRAWQDGMRSRRPGAYEERQDALRFLGMADRQQRRQERRERPGVRSGGGGYRARSAALAERFARLYAEMQAVESGERTAAEAEQRIRDLTRPGAATGSRSTSARACWT